MTWLKTMTPAVVANNLSRNSSSSEPGRPGYVGLLVKPARSQHNASRV